MTRISIAGPYVQGGYIGWVNADVSTYYCNIAIVYKSKPGDKQLGEWKCNSLPGKAMLNLAKTAMLLDRPVEVTLQSGTSKVKRVLAITLK
ncbi:MULTISPECIES: hypothetical protein [unclassified Bartonella]|uniref:hypothetical protein n=1 Tax=unclassified Bartonella TaxID=2645622 RepID=UPI00129478B1|nr:MULTISPECIES: hypothetical protein [unclassified Bartonella]